MLYHGCVFHWFSKMQRSVALSSAEAEYFGAMLAAKDVLFARDLLFDLGIVLKGACIIFCDSKSAVDMAFDPVAFKKTKHILRAAEFLRDLVERGLIVLTHVSGKIMIADCLTKAVARVIFMELLRLIDEYSSKEGLNVTVRVTPSSMIVCPVSDPNGVSVQEGLFQGDSETRARR